MARIFVTVRLAIYLFLLKQTQNLIGYTYIISPNFQDRYTLSPFENNQILPIFGNCPWEEPLRMVGAVFTPIAAHTL